MEQKIVERMGTMIVLQIYHSQAAELLEQADKMLEDYEKRFSANSPTSDLMIVNHHAGIQPIQVDEDLFELIQIGKEYSISSQCALNIAIGPLIKLWKIGFEGASVPEPEEIEAKLKLIDPKNIVLNSQDKTVFLKEKGMEIDLGALAKGYFADQLKKFFIENNVQNGFIDLGGNVLTISDNPKYEDGHWRIGIQNVSQDRGDLAGAVLVKNKSVVTSGIYERELIHKGEHYHHIFDSVTGYPIENNMASVTVVSDLSIEGELLTTLLFSMEAEEAIRYVEALEGIEVIVMTKDKNIKITRDLRPYVALFDE